jgi:hypothetical protein
LKRPGLRCPGDCIAKALRMSCFLAGDMMMEDAGDCLQLVPGDNEEVQKKKIGEQSYLCRYLPLPLTTACMTRSAIIGMVVI